MFTLQLSARECKEISLLRFVRSLSILRRWAPFWINTLMWRKLKNAGRERENTSEWQNESFNTERTQLFFSPFFSLLFYSGKMCNPLTQVSEARRKSAELLCDILAGERVSWTFVRIERAFLVNSAESRGALRCDDTYCMCMTVKHSVEFNFKLFRTFDYLKARNYCNLFTWTTWKNYWIFFFMLDEAICCWSLFNDVSDDNWTLFSYPFTKRSMKNSKVSSLSRILFKMQSSRAAQLHTEIFSHFPLNFLSLSHSTAFLCEGNWLSFGLARPKVSSHTFLRCYRETSVDSL